MDFIVSLSYNIYLKIKYLNYSIISYMYAGIMKFPKEKYQVKTLVTKDFISIILNILNGQTVLHHSHMTGKVIGYAQDFCNKRLKENENLVLAFAHNLFSFDILFVIKGIRLCV